MRFNDIILVMQAAHGRDSLNVQQGAFSTGSSTLNMDRLPAMGSVAEELPVQAALGSDRVEVQQGAFLTGRGADYEIDIAVRSCRAADVCILMLGLSTNNPRVVSQVGFP